MHHILSRLVCLVLGLVAGSALAADGGVIAADEAFEAAKRGELVLIDVRTPAEWRQTGIPEGARAVDVTAPGGLEAFITGVTQAVGGDRTRPLAVICRSGNRSTRAMEMLQQNGFTSVRNIKEGMAGSGAGPGWLRRGLPVTACPEC